MIKLFVTISIEQNLVF